MIYLKKFLISLVCIFSFVQLALSYELTILHSNDIHGRVVPVEYYSDKPAMGGWSRRAGVIKDVKSSVKNTLTVDVGDIAQGTVYYQLFDGIPEMNFLDMVGYDAFCVGNHELDKGVDNFENLAKFTKTPLLSANLEFINHYYLNGKVKTHIIKQYDGFKVGVIGMMTPALKTMSSSADDVELRDYDKTLKFLVDFLREDVDLVVLLSHSGFKRDLQTANTIDGIDIIVGGHSHTFLKEPFCVKKNGRRTLIVQAGEFGLHLGRLNLDFADDGISSYDYYLIPLDENAPIDKKIAKEVKKLDGDIKHIKTASIGKTKIDIDASKNSVRTSLTNSGVLVNNVLKSLVPEADISMVNAGSIRAHRVIKKGALTQMDIMEMLPFPNKIVTLEMKGSDIKSILETSARYLPNNNRAFLQTLGLSYTINLFESPQVLSEDLTKLIKAGSRIKDVKINGEPLNEDKYYKIVTVDYLASGGDGFFQFKNAKSLSKTNYRVTKAVIDYIVSKKRVKPRVKDEIILEE